MEIIKKYLDNGQYVKEKTLKTSVVFHHTAGGHRPDFTIDGWNKDTLGRIATQYVIGGISITDGNSDFDGKIYKCFEEENYAFHLGIKGNNNRFDKCSIGIEICNYGYLKKVGDNYINYVNKLVPSNQVVDLGYSFKGYRYWHKYSDKQIASLKFLLQDISKRHNIPITQVSFSFLENVLKQNEIKGVFTHVNFRQDKWDCSPQPNLVNMLKELL
jgi:hypothetical protein